MPAYQILPDQKPVGRPYHAVSHARAGSSITGQAQLQIATGTQALYEPTALYQPTLTSNACDTVGWRTPSPNRGCAEPTDAPAPGVKTHLSRREREQPSWPLQSSQLARYLSCPHRKYRDANPDARGCPQVLRSWCYIPCSCHRTST